MLLRGIPSDGWNWVLFSCLFILSKSPATAQLSLSTTGGVQCYGEQVTLLCTHPVLPQEPEYLQTDVSWRRDGNGINVGGLGKTNPNPMTTKLEFTITNSTEGNYTCFLVNAVQGGVDETNTATVRPPDQPGPPVVTMATTDSSITLTWNTILMCFESEIFNFVVIWNKIGSGISSSTTVSSPPYTISGLQPGTSYEVSVHGVSGSGVVSERRVLNVTTGAATNTHSGLSAALIAGIVVASVVTCLLIFLAVLGAGVIAHSLYKKKSTHTSQSSESAEDKVTSSTPGYMNVELEDKSVPMTDNPSYEHVQRTQLTKPLYGNL